jgi:DNA-binding NtrC family response regulator
MANKRKPESEVDSWEDMLRVRGELRELLDETTGVFVPEELNVEPGIDFYSAVADYERGIIATAMEMADGHLCEAARLLHMHPSTLSMRMKALQMNGHGRKDGSMLKANNPA